MKCNVEFVENENYEVGDLVFYQSELYQFLENVKKGTSFEKVRKKKISKVTANQSM